MGLKTVVITITKKGSSKEPSYSLTVEDDGTVVFRGLNNVGVIGEKRFNISEEKSISILSELKESGFFSLDKDKSLVNEDSNRSVTSIRVEMNIEGVAKSKEISFYDDDIFVPDGIKNFVKNTIENTGISKFLDKGFKISSKNGKLTDKTKNLKILILNKKIIVLFVCVLVVLGGIIVILPGDTSEIDENDNKDNDNNSSDTNNSDNNSNYNSYNDSKIVFFTTTDSFLRFNNERSTIVTDFTQGDTIYLDYEFENVTHLSDNNSLYNISVQIIVIYNSKVYYQNSYNYTSYHDDNDSLYFIDEFYTNKSWPSGDYDISLKLEDKISGKNGSSQISFYLNEILLNIDVLETASEINGYQDYEPLSFFNLNEDIMVYCEYSGIYTNENECNLLLKLNITHSGIVILSFTEEKTVADDNYHFWSFKPDDSWDENSLYTINFYIYDYNTDLSDEEFSFFWLGN